MKLSIHIWTNILECLAVLRKRIIIENLKSLLFQSFWECSAHCCSTLPVLLETKGSKKGWEDDGWYHRCKSQLRPPALGRWFAGSGWNFEGRCQWKPNRSGWKRTDGEPVLQNPSVPTLWGCLRQGRRCAGLSHGKWLLQSWVKPDPSSCFNSELLSATGGTCVHASAVDDVHKESS